MNPGSARRTNRAEEIVAHEAALFIAREAGTESLITVVGAKSMANGDRIGVFVSIFPAEKAQTALAFLERQRHAFSEHLKTHARLRLPRIDFLLENGEHSGGEMPKNQVV